MISAKLFFGFFVNESLATQLNHINPKLLSIFIQNEENYLQEIYFQERKYLGKFIGEAIDLNQLQLLEVNIYSILKRIAPDYPFEKHPLVILPLQVTNG